MLAPSAANTADTLSEVICMADDGLGVTMRAERDKVLQQLLDQRPLAMLAPGGFKHIQPCLLEAC
jgi:hypothetical protein